MTWAARRRIIILLIVFVVLFAGAFYELAPVIFKAPMCNDGVQDGTETGVDCGGICTNLCTAEVQPPVILWSRSFPVTDTVYNAVADIENKNNAATRAISYEFRLYDEKGLFVTSVDGTATIPPNGEYAIVETGIAVGPTVIGHTTFAFSSTPAVWEHIPETVESLQALTSNLQLDVSGSIPKLSAQIYNPSPTITLNGTTVAAILYDADDNAVNVSKTVVPILAPEAKLPIYFTWPRPFSTTITRSELVPIIDVFHTTQ